MDTPEQLRIDYVKTNGYRTVHADGANGNVTPDLNIFFAFWLQRGSIPNFTMHNRTPDGRGFMGEAAQTNNTATLVREIDYGVIMTVEVAKQVHEWLGTQIAIAEKLRSAAPVQAPPTI